MSAVVGRVLGTQDAMPLEFWVAVGEGEYLQLDDVVLVETPLPDGTVVKLFGLVDMVRARHEGARFDSDVFLIEKGVLPAEVAQAAHVRVTRVEPEVFVPPLPGREVRRAVGADRDQALFFDGMERRVPIGLSRDGEPVFANLDFLDGTRGAHVNISGISGVATKTSYASFLLYSLFHAGGFPGGGAYGLVFNVKGEDLLFLDRPNREAPAQGRRGLCPAGPARPALRQRAAPGAGPPGLQGAAPRYGQPPVGRAGLLLDAARVRGRAPAALPVRRGPGRAVAARPSWSTRWKRSCSSAWRRAVPRTPGSSWAAGGWRRSTSWWRRYPAGLEGPGIRGAPGTLAAFERRLHAAAARVGHLIRGRDVGRSGDHRLDWRRRQLTVVDIHNLHDRAKRFVVGARAEAHVRGEGEPGHG